MNEDHHEALWEQIEEQWESGNVVACRDGLESLVRRYPDDADAWHLLGICHEQGGDAESMRRCFHTTWTLDERQYPPQQARLDPQQFEDIVEEAIGLLKGPVRDALDEVAVILAWRPDRTIVDQPPWDPRLLGLFDGPTWSEMRATEWAPQDPPRLTLFQGNLERSFPDFEELREEIAITLFHELGHFLGLDEEDLDDRGLQ